MRKRISALFILLFLLCLPVFAGGAGESFENNDGLFNTDTTLSTEELIATSSANKWSSMVLNQIANSFDHVTFNFCIAMTPFPETLRQFWGQDSNSNEISVSNSLLLGDGYWESSSSTNANGTIEASVYKSDGTATTLSAYVGRDSGTQRSTWNMVKVLFVLFLAAEILFSSIYGYLTDREGGVVKDIAAKTVMCLLLILLASALPFLIEAFRTGFHVIALNITGIEARYNDNRGAWSSGDHSSWTTQQQLLYNMRNANAYQLPGLLCRNIASIIEITSPEVMGIYEAVAYEDEVNDVSKILTGLKNLLIQFIYMIVRLVVCILTIFSSLHVMLNVVEVYLLLGIVICIMPFAIFGPLKFLGEKAVMSLFSNLMELFVLMVILFSTQNIGIEIMSQFSAFIMSAPKDVEYRMQNVTYNELMALWPDLFDEDDIPEGASADDIGLYNFNIRFVESTDENGYPVVSGSMSPAFLDVSGGGADSDDLCEAFRKTLTDALQSYPVENTRLSLILGAMGMTGDQVEELADTRKVEAGSLTGNEQGASRERSFVITATTLTDLYSSTLIPLANITFSPVIGSEDFAFGSTEQFQRVSNTGDTLSLVCVHLVFSILCCLMQTYFVNQSSQITNAVLSGNVASEGISAALGKMLAGKAAGMAAGAGAAAASAPFKAAGGGVKAGFAAKASQMEKDGKNSGMRYAIYSALGGGEYGAARGYFDAKNGLDKKKPGPNASGGEGGVNKG